MKTAISIPDPLFKAAEKTAKKLHMSRSELYSVAIEEFLKSHDSKNITKKINEVCQQEDTSVDPVLFKLQMLTLSKDEEW